MSELTAWFVNGEKPVREGVYEVQIPEYPAQLFSYWNGANFNWLATIKDGAFSRRSLCGGGADVTAWRGLTHNPEASHE